MFLQYIFFFLRLFAENKFSAVPGEGRLATRSQITLFQAQKVNPLKEIREMTFFKKIFQFKILF